MGKLKLNITKRVLHFKQPAGTSRGIYTERPIWLIEATDNDRLGVTGLGECAPLPDLSCDASPDYDQKLSAFCLNVESIGTIDYDAMACYPSMLMGIETALLTLQRGSTALYDTPFARGEQGITINGLVWMGTIDQMLERMQQKLNEGFRCIKLKIGALDFNRELEMVKQLRASFGKDVVEVRLDANGGFGIDVAMDRLEALAKYDIHSIEQPIKAGNWRHLSELCARSPIAIALDEELIGLNHQAQREEMLDKVMPQYVVVKPSLHGGLQGTRQWVSLANERGVGSWITSALESNVGLNAIAHLAADIYGPDIAMPQGLGTGMLFTDNIEMPIGIVGDKLYYKP